MARQIKGPIPGLNREHVLTCFDERNETGALKPGGYCSANDPTPPTVVIRWPTEEERRTLIDASVQEQISFATMAKLVARFVVACSNYDRPDGKPVGAGPEFASNAEVEAIAEIFGVLVKGVKTVESDPLAKNV